MRLNIPIVLLALSAAAPALAEPETREPVKIFISGTSDSDFINVLYGEVLKEYGYRVKYVQSDFGAHFVAVETGAIDISLGAWQTIPAMTEAAIATGKVKVFGSTGVKTTEGWWYSKELEAFCPGLPDWSAFKNPDCVAALATADTAPLGRYVDAPADWATDSADFIAKEGLQLANVNSGSPSSLIAELKAAVDQKKPFLGWGYYPHWVINPSIGNFVDRPGLLRDNDVLKIGNVDIEAKIPNAITILEKFSITTEDVQWAMDKVDNEGMSQEDVAAEWMAGHDAEWKAWLP